MGSFVRNSSIQKAEARGLLVPVWATQETLGSVFVNKKKGGGGGSWIDGSVADLLRLVFNSQQPHDSSVVCNGSSK